LKHWTPNPDKVKADRINMSAFAEAMALKEATIKA
jgi:hypothetical protein